MLVNYDFSSDEEQKQPTNTTANAKPPINNNTTNKPSSTNTKPETTAPKKITINPIKIGSKPPTQRSKLPDVGALLNSIPEGPTGDSSPKKTNLSNMFTAEDFRNCPPPEFSLRQEGEFREQVEERYGAKRRIQRESKDGEEWSSMDKYQKLDGKVNNQWDNPPKKAEQIQIESSNKEKNNTKEANRLIPTQTKLKRANIPMEH